MGQDRYAVIKKGARLFRHGLGTRLGKAGLLVVLLWAGFLLCVPVVDSSDPLGTAILDRHGRLLGAVTAADGQWRFGPPKTIPEKYERALLEYEDRRFFLHPGIDPLAILRAAIEDIRAGRIVSGGSTITMQVVRMTRRGKRRTFYHKAIECLLAVRMEAALSKRDILLRYAALAPFGGNTVGLQAASWRYFGRPPGRLSWAEAATLAVLPNAPSLIHPGRRRTQLLARRNALLRRLFHRGFLDETTLDLAVAEPLPERARPMPRIAPHLLESARREVPSGGIIRTTLDADIQRRILRLAQQHHRILSAGGIEHLAALVADTRTGEVLAYLGNGGSPGAPGSQVDLIRARRSSGSILKPFLFAAMLQDGEILPYELIPDIPTRISGFAPLNFDHGYSGAVPAAVALSRSLNVPAVRMLRSHGVDRFAALLKRLGLRTLFRPAEDYGLSLILGGAEVRLWEAASLYAGLGRTLLVFFDDEGTPGHAEEIFRPLVWRVGEQKTGSPSPFSAGVCYTTLEALLEVSRPGMDAAWRSFSSSRPIAWKTGTSWGFRDAWAFGVTPGFTVGVWAGNADGEGRPGLTGHSAAAPLLFSIFDSLPGSSFFRCPESDMSEVEVCAFSGLIAGRACGSVKKMLLPTACLPGKLCPYCRSVHLDASGTHRVDSSCADVADMQRRSFFILPPQLAVEYRLHHPEYRSLPPWKEGCRPVAGNSLSCLYPEAGAEIYIPMELNEKRGRMIAEAADSDASAVVFWHLDGHYLGETRGEHRMALAPEPGAHVLVLVDSAGAVLGRRFIVLGRPTEEPVR